MFGFKDRDGRLYKRITAVSESSIQKILAPPRGPNTLAQVAALLSMMCAGRFLSYACKQMPDAVKGIRRDVLAFEALAFAAYAIREAYSPMAAEIEQDMEDEEDDFVDTERQKVAEAFRYGAGVCEAFVVEDTGWEVERIFANRLMTYHSAPTLGGQQGGAERFRFLLLCVGNVREPQLRYGAPSLDLTATMQSMTAVHAFASTMPKGCADTLRNIREEFGL